VGQELSIWQLVSHASMFVQIIMLILVLASVVSWYQIVQRVIYFSQTSAAWLGWKVYSEPDLKSLRGLQKRRLIPMP
jgi:biopolymer transport protein ExbB/TolQ